MEKPNFLYHKQGLRINDQQIINAKALSIHFIIKVLFCRFDLSFQSLCQLGNDLV